VAGSFPALIAPHRHLAQRSFSVQLQDHRSTAIKRLTRDRPPFYYLILTLSCDMVPACCDRFVPKSLQRKPTDPELGPCPQGRVAGDWADIIVSMSADALDTEYENAVADVLAAVMGDRATVGRNVKLPGYKTKRTRQIDVLVQSDLFGSGDAMMVVDCKRYAKPVDINTIGAFVALIDDVNADMGLLVCTHGATKAAQVYARSLRGIRLSVMGLDTLAAWRPAGTVEFVYAVPSDMLAEATRETRRVGFRVRYEDVAEFHGLPGHTGLSAYRHFGTRSPSGEVQAEARERLEAALRRVGVDPTHTLSGGVTIDGGTPSHRWLPVTLDGILVGLTILAATEDDVERQLNAVLAFTAVPRERLDVVRPDGWPFPRVFPNW